ncbi:MAG: redoxin domain-containing protein [Acidobacteriaceae bacterium]|nr:redoxin domain-containing protein [Acidobacteriaceae bacterium]
MALAIVAVSSTVPANSATQSGLQPGASIPAFTLADQSDTPQTFASLRGPNGLLILFNRSADWCPFCKSQLIDLEAARQNFERKGINVVAVTYDSPEVLQSFALRRGIHYQLLSDPDSRLIDAFGIRNPEAVGNEAGVPIPNYFLIGADGVIAKRHAETGLADRVTASYFYESIFGAGSALPLSAAIIPQTPHVKIELLQSDRAAAPGARIRLTVQIDPGKGAHLYAPGSDHLGYHSVRLLLEPSSLYSVHPATYPKSALLKFPQLHEEVPVFLARTVITQDVVAIRSPETIAQFEKNPNLIIRGTFEYQVCTGTTCFPPTKAAVQWHLDVKSGDLDSVRVPESLRKP